MSLHVNREGIRQIVYRFKGISRRADNLTPVWPRVGTYLAQSNRKQFSTQGMHYGTPWRPLKPDYAQWKLRNGYGRTILVMSGGMKASFTSRPMSIERYYKKSAVYGSNYWLAKFHQDGTHRNGKQANPPRPMMVKNKQVVGAVHHMIATYIKDGKVPAARNYL